MVSVYIINGEKYYRTICIDCFFKQEQRLPSRPNIPNLDYGILLNIPYDIISEYVKEKRKEKRITLNNLIRKYGEEEGNKRWAKINKSKSKFFYPL